MLSLVLSVSWNTGLAGRGHGHWLLALLFTGVFCIVVCVRRHWSTGGVENAGYQVVCSRRAFIRGVSVGRQAKGLDVPTSTLLYAARVCSTRAVEEAYYPRMHAAYRGSLLVALSRRKSSLL